MYIYQDKNRYFAQCADDIKDLVQKEIEVLGGFSISQAYRGMYFSSSMVDMYRINFRSRLAGRILAPLSEFQAMSEDELYKLAGKRIDWKKIIPYGRTFAIYATTVHSNIRHSKFAALRLKDAIADQMRGSDAGRPDVDTKAPDVGINLHIQNNRVTISVDTSGGSLHRRGYKAKGHQAPMMETLAASIINLTGWDGEQELVDPMCGSGTFLCEALLKRTNTPPGILRERFGFEFLPGFDRKNWEKVKNEELDKSQAVGNLNISGSDISEQSVQQSKYSLMKLPFGGDVQVQKKDIFDRDDLEGKMIVCNPPYGIRMKNEALGDFYKDFGDFLKQKCKGSTAFIYFGNRQHIKNLGLRTSMKRPLANGKLDGRLVRIDVY